MLSNLSLISRISCRDCTLLLFDGYAKLVYFSDYRIAATLISYSGIYKDEPWQLMYTDI